MKNTLQVTTNENEQLKQQYNEIQEKYDLLIRNNHNLNTFDSPSSDEIQQLQTNISLLTTQCSQLDEANRACQQFHQNQLELLCQKLQDHITLNTDFTLEQIANEMLNQLSSYQQNESVLHQNLEELNKKLVDVQKQSEEVREENAQLIQSKQQIEELQLSKDNSQPTIDLNHFRNKFQNYIPLHENLAFDELPQVILEQIVKEREEFNQQYQTLEKQNHHLQIGNSFSYIFFSHLIYLFYFYRI